MCNTARANLMILAIHNLFSALKIRLKKHLRHAFVDCIDCVICSREIASSNVLQT